MTIDYNQLLYSRLLRPMDGKTGGIVDLERLHLEEATRNHPESKHKRRATLRILREQCIYTLTEF